MATSSFSGARRPPRRRRGRWFLLAGLLMAWLLGRGLGVFGAGPEATSPDTEQSSGAAAAPASAAGEGGAAPLGEIAATGAVRAGNRESAVQPTATPPEAGAVPAAPAQTTQGAPPVQLPPPGAATTTPAHSSRAVDHDRFASNLSLLVTRTERGELASALAALAHLRSLPLDGAQRAVLDGPAATLEQAVADACAALLQGLCRGEVFAARDQVARLFGDGPQWSPFVQEALRPWQLDGDLFRPAPAGDVAWPLPIPLPRHREVRVRWRGTTVTAHVVDSRSDQVTVCVRTARGQSFPTVAAAACEPVGPTADEAVEMALVALQANDPVTARLWLVVARQRGDGGLGSRGDRVAERLRS